MGYICNVTTREEQTIYLDIPLRKLTHILYCEKPNNLYHSFEIKKKSGGTRHINAPNDELIGLQRKIAKALEDYEEILRKNKNIKSNISHAFEKNKSIITNAQIHRNKRIVINLDLKDFFPSIHFGRVLGFFTKNKDYNLSYEVAVILAQLCCLNGCLPQGAPTSPILSNLICRILDIRLLKLAKKYKVDYTRYADDLTFSTNNKAFLEMQYEFLEEITKEVTRAGFSINNKKTRIQFRNSKQEVTGLIVNKKINIDRCYYRETRAMAHSLYVNNEFFINGVKGTINQLEGRFSFINQIDEYNNKLDKESPFSVILRNGNEEGFRRFNKTQHDYKALNGREEEYRKFLFYKNFYANNKPLIVTEGKTDIRYLKAALKNLHKDYPDLIAKTDTGFEFKISFFNRTQKRFLYLFNLTADGADSLTKYYNYFTGKENYNNYFSFFAQNAKLRPVNPAILLFDNEITNKTKPLNNFVNSLKLPAEEKKQLTAKLLSDNFHKLVNAKKGNGKSEVKEPEVFEKILNRSNLYILTNQLVGDKTECEIEDLFDEKTLNLEIGGKTFSRKDEDKEKYYNKDIFSNYIASHYWEIDFTNFKPLLNNINKIVKDYQEIKV